MIKHFLVFQVCYYINIYYVGIIILPFPVLNVVCMYYPWVNLFERR